MTSNGTGWLRAQRPTVAAPQDNVTPGEYHTCCYCELKISVGHHGRWVHVTTGLAACRRGRG